MRLKACGLASVSQIATLCFLAFIADSILSSQTRLYLEQLQQNITALTTTVELRMDQNEQQKLNAAVVQKRIEATDRRKQELEAELKVPLRWLLACSIVLPGLTCFWSQAAGNNLELYRRLARGDVHKATFRDIDVNRIVTTGPFCKAKSVSPKLPTFLFVAGVEGSGHHALLSVWQHLQAKHLIDLVVYDQQFHALGIENHASYHYSSILPEQHHSAMLSRFANATRDNSIVIDAQNSYPMGQFAGSLAHPDLGSLLELDGSLFNLRVIVLHRNPTDAVLSAVRRFRDSDDAKYKAPEYQARVVAESLTNINNLLSDLPCGRWMLMRYEDLISNPTLFSGPFARLLELPKTDIQEAFKSIRAPPARPETEQIKKDKRLLDQFFERQQATWPIITAATTQTTSA
jgi:hypothetical protein